MPTVFVEKYQNLSAALRKLKRLCEKDGLLRRAKEERYHEKRSDKQRKDKAAARRRTQKNIIRESMSLKRVTRKKRRR